MDIFFWYQAYLNPKSFKIKFKTFWIIAILVWGMKSKKNVEKIGRFVDFWIFMAIYMDKLDQF